MGDTVSYDWVNWVTLGKGSEVGIVPKTVADIEDGYLLDWGACDSMFVGE